MADGERTHPTPAVTRKPDDDVGKSGLPPAGSAGQTPEQAAITGIGPSGLSDADREEGWREGGEPGRNPAPVGGSSQGHADRKVADDRDGEKSGRGHYGTEKETG